MADRTARQILDETEELLRTAQFGLRTCALAQSERARTGLRNSVVFGRMVTFALQNLRSVSPDFEAWYAEKQDAMKTDPLQKRSAPHRLNHQSSGSNQPIS